MKELALLDRSATEIEDASDIAGARDSFKPLSDAMYATIRQFGTGGRRPIYRFLCSMAFDNTGAHWLQDKQDLENPYWGSMMFRCGEMTETVVAGPKGMGEDMDMDDSRGAGEHRHE
jgi:Cu(I)/Ag(I) efflux system membrane fusion protein